MRTPRSHSVGPPGAPAFLPALIIAICVLIGLLFVYLWLAQSIVLPQARERDLNRVKLHTQLAKHLLEADAVAGLGTEQTLAKIRKLGIIDPEVLALENTPAGQSPRYILPRSQVEAWEVFHAPDGQAAGVVRIARRADTSRWALGILRMAAAILVVGGLLGIAATILLLYLPIARNLQRIAALTRSKFGLPPQDHRRAAQNPLEDLELALQKAAEKVTRADEQRRQLLDGHSEMACLETSDGTLLEVNAAYCRLFGKTRDELVGSNYLDLIPPSERTDAVNSMRKLSRRNPVHLVEHRVILPDGSMRWIRWTDTAVFGHDDTVTAVLSFGADITAEKNLADQIGALQSASGQMQSLAQTGSLTWDFTRDRMEWTDETWRLLGLDRNSSQPSLDNLLALVTPNDRESLRALFRQAHDSGDPFEQEFRCVLADGSRRTLQSRAEVRADPQTKILDRLTCTLRDITALRDAEAATKRELRFREAVEQSLASGIVASDDQGRILSVNTAFCAMTGWSEGELLGQLPPYPYWPEEEIAAIQKAFATTLGGATPPEGYALRFCRKDSSRFDVLVNVAPLLDANDRRLGWLGSVTDITNFQETRRRLREANQRLETARDLAALGLWSWNPETGEIQWDARSFELYGHPGATDAAMVWRRLQPEAETARAEQNILQAEAEGRTSGHFLVAILWPDGSKHTIESSFRRLREPGTSLTRFTGVHRDITADIQRERELRTTNERLETAQKVVEFGIWDWDPVRNKLFWDRQSFALFGRPAATDAEAIWAEVLPEEKRERLTSELLRLIAAGGTSGEDLFDLQWPDGSRHEISSTYLIMRDDRGEAIRVFGVNRDITNEVETARELRDAHQRLAAALEGGPFGTFEHIIGQGDVNWNLANYEMNGIDPSVTEPAELFAAWKKGTGDFFPQLMACMAALPAWQDRYSYQLTAYPDDQEPRQLRVSLFIERNKQGHPARLVGLTRRLDGATALPPTPI